MAGSRYDTLLPIPLGYVRMRGGAPITGLTVTVSVANALTGGSLLASTSISEVGTGSGLYTYSWASGIAITTECVASYSVTDGLGTKIYKEHFTITNATDAIESGEGKSV